ncbi:MAG: zinc ABC transporter substrate-binding protein [Alphaproteobacteria bacterium]|nr:zinc ABC transporter substrate-binding protein [Alphaproteobacteria bacterium]PHY00832.1 MAG: zinc ABC transporter substrate-binding protein [Rhodospirillaceae bacterium]
MKSSLTWTCVWLGALVPMSAMAAPKVVVSIKPIASLVDGVMAGVGVPTVIVGAGQSLHTFSMKPSDAKALNTADVVFWVGEGLETFLDKPIRALSSTATVVALMDAPGLTLLKGREGGVWEEQADEHADHDHDHSQDHDDHEVDGHLWLDPKNAKAVVNKVHLTLSQIDTVNAAIYAANAKSLSQRIDVLDLELKQNLAPIAQRPFIVFHDGYQYFEAHYGLNAVGSMTVSPDRMPGAKRVGEIKDKIRTLQAACVFAEPQFEPKLIQTLIGGTSAKIGTLDPEASTLPAGPNLYFDLMRGLANNLRNCLAL